MFEITRYALHAGCLTDQLPSHTNFVRTTNAHMSQQSTEEDFLQVVGL